MRYFSILLSIFWFACVPVYGQDAVRKALIRDITSIEGIRENPVIGYGVVVGLRNTGDKQQTIFTTQMLGNILQHMGVQIPSGTVIVKNVAAVFVTANLPPFASPGTQLDVTVSSAGDARSLEGGLLLLTPLYGADGQVYAAAQGPLILGGYSEGTKTNSKQVNHPTVGRIPGGGLVERDSSLDLRKLERVSLLLNEPNFSTAEDVAGAINREFGKEVTSVVDSRRIDIDTVAAGAASLPALMARAENLTVQVHHRAR
jgi:flagellar P-ring protein precursor FlgI